MGFVYPYFERDNNLLHYFERVFFYPYFERDFQNRDKRDNRDNRDNSVFGLVAYPLHNLPINLNFILKLIFIICLLFLFLCFQNFFLERTNCVCFRIKIIHLKI